VFFYKKKILSNIYDHLNRAFPEKLTMHYLDDEKTVKIYIKDQQKDLFYQLEDMSDIKDRCVLKLIEINPQNSSQISLASNSTIVNNFVENKSISSNNKTNNNNLIYAKQQADMVNSYCYGVSNNSNMILNENEMAMVSKDDCSLLSNRSLSEPRPQGLPPAPKSNAHYQLQNSQHIYANQNAIMKTPIQYQMSVETYDNLNDTSSAHHHQSRINNGQQYSQYPNSSFYSEKANNQAGLKSYSRMVPPERDIRSVDREIIMFTNQPTNQTKLGISNNSNPKQHHRHSLINPPTTITTSSVSRPNDTTTSLNIDNGCRSGSITPQNQQFNMIEDDDVTTASSLSSTARLSTSMSTDQNGTLNRKKSFKNNSSFSSATNHVENSNLDKHFQDAFLNVLEDNDIGNFENSQVKMKLMQQQLQTLTNLVHQALINRDLNQLATQYNMQKFNPMSDQMPTNSIYFN
jgi:hypothetical protein